MLTLDDILLEDGKVAPFSRVRDDYAAMGRFGNVLLVSGEPDLALTAKPGEVVRLYLTNTANTRVFKVKLPGARMKLVGGDSGRVEHEQFVEDVVLAPSERVIVHVLFDAPGRSRWSTTPPSGSIRWPRSPSARSAAEPSLEERSRPCAPTRNGGRARAHRAVLEAEPDKSLAFIAEMEFDAPEAAGRLRVPHASGRRQRGARPLPQCGMTLLAIAAPATVYACPMHPRSSASSPATARTAA